MTPLPSTCFQSAKSVVLSYYQALDAAQSQADILAVMDSYIGDDYLWRGVHPFHERCDPHWLATEFWQPLKKSLYPLQRRADILFAGLNKVDGFTSTWVVQMGHFMGLFDTAWLGIAATGKMAFLRYAEFHRVQHNKIVETTLHIDIPMLMVQAGVDPFPPQTGAFFVQPGPKTHDGMLFADGNSTLTAQTHTVIDRMKYHVMQGRQDKSLDGLGDAWHEDMIWFGPCGIGATYTKHRYQTQHRHPLVRQMNFDIPDTSPENHIGHIAVVAEGNYGGFFGWPNFRAIPTGGFMGLPANDTVTEWRVADIYRICDNKIAENWVFIDMLHFAYMQGVDVLDRTQQTTQAQNYTGWST